MKANHLGMQNRDNFCSKKMLNIGHLITENAYQCTSWWKLWILFNFLNLPVYQSTSQPIYQSTNLPIYQFCNFSVIFNHDYLHIEKLIILFAVLLTDKSSCFVILFLSIHKREERKNNFYSYIMAFLFFAKCLDSCCCL